MIDGRIYFVVEEVVQIRDEKTSGEGLLLQSLFFYFAIFFPSTSYVC